MNTVGWPKVALNKILSRSIGDSIGSDGMSFDYRLRPGPTTSRNAIALLCRQGAAPALLALAEARAGQLDSARRNNAPSQIPNP